MTVAAVVLAAGGGARWNGAGHKLLTEIAGRPLAAHALIAAAEAGLDELVVVTGSVDLSAVLPIGATVLHNDRWIDGQATSLRLAVDYAERVGHAAVVVGLADMPGVPAAAWRAVADCPSPLAVATFDGLRRPPTRIARLLWPKLPTTGDEGGRVLLSEQSSHVVEVACPGNPEDVDTVEDLEPWN